MWWGRILWLLHLQKGPHCWDPEQKNQTVSISIPAPRQRGMHNQRNWPLCHGEDHQHPWVHHFVGGWVWPTPSRRCQLAHEHTLGVQLDFTSLGSLQLTISHQIVMGVCDQCQTQVVAIQLALPEPLDQPDFSPQTEVLWANKKLFNQPMSDYTTPKSLDEL